MHTLVVFRRSGVYKKLNMGLTSKTKLLVSFSNKSHRPSSTICGPGVLRCLH